MEARTATEAEFAKAMGMDKDIAAMAKECKAGNMTSAEAMKALKKKYPNMAPDLAKKAKVMLDEAEASEDGAAEEASAGEEAE